MKAEALRAMIDLVSKATKIKTKYPLKSDKEILETKINDLEKKYCDKNGENAHLILKHFMEDYLLFNQHRLPEDCDVRAFKIDSSYDETDKIKPHSFFWATIYPNLENGQKAEVINWRFDRRYQKYPQLTLLINKDGINCAFTYGYDVLSESPGVQVIKKYSKLVKDDYSDFFFKIRGKGLSPENLPVFPDHSPSDNYGKVLVSSIPENLLTKHWTVDSQIVKIIPLKEIKRDMRKDLVFAFDKIFKLFELSVNAIREQKPEIKVH